MTTSITAIVNGVEYDLNDASRYLWMSDDGLGMAPLHRIVERGPQQHGETDLGFRLDPRTIKLVIGAFGTDDSDYWDIRRELLGIFTPTTNPIGLRFGLPNGDTRQIDVHVSGEFQIGSSDRKRIAHKIGMMLRASDPTFYDPTGQAYAFNIGGGSSGWTVATIVPSPIGSTNLAQSRTVTYSGTWRTYPTVKITGPITNPVVANNTTGEKLDFTGTTITAGHYYLIDTRFGVKTVLDDAGANQYSKLTSDSKLNTFHLEVHPVAPNGANDIQVSGTSITSATEVSMTFFSRYIGI
jgi:hypothetical protein